MSREMIIGGVILMVAAIAAWAYTSRPAQQPMTPPVLPPPVAPPRTTGSRGGSGIGDFLSLVRTGAEIYGQVSGPQSSGLGAFNGGK